MRKVGKPEKYNNIIPDNTIGFPDCPNCSGKGYVWDKRLIESDVDYSKSKRGRSIWVCNTYYVQCPICNPKNNYKPLLDCPLCSGVHTNDNTCPYCDLIYDKLKEKKKSEWESRTLYQYEQIDRYGATKKELLKYIANVIVTGCKPYKKENPEVFQYHPLAYAYRKVLREIWA